MPDEVGEDSVGCGEGSGSNAEEVRRVQSGKTCALRLLTFVLKAIKIIERV